MMTLDNLVSIGRLQRTPIDREFITRLTIAARRSLAEVETSGIGPDTRFDLAYKCIHRIAMASLAAKGFRTSQNQPGHHQTAIQCLGWSMGVPKDTLITLDALRKQRNLSDYSGDPISAEVASTCIAEAEALLGIAGQRLAVDNL
jgi:hypothetical protein